MSELVLRSADDSMVEALKALWLSCFPDDSADDVEAFYKTVFPQTECLVGTVDGQPVTMLHLLPAVAYVCGAPYKVRYLYAGCTHPFHRHRGYYAELMEFAKSRVTEMGEKGIYLHPATPGLAPLYEKAGYRMCIHSTLSAAQNTSWPRFSGSITDYAQWRHVTLEDLSRKHVYFEPNSTVSALFIDAKLREGVCLYSNEDCVIMAKDGYELHPMPPAAASQPSAMWLPIGEACPVTKAIDTFGAYTALLGE